MAMTTRELLDALRKHYIAPNAGPLDGGAFVHEVGFNGGHGGRTRADALWVDFTSAGGYALIGHELKVSRSDWLHELAHPLKSEAWASQCHQWWIVAPPGVVQAGEVPAGSGLLVSTTARRFKAVVKAPTRKAQPSWDAARSIIARLDTLRRQELNAVVDEQVRGVLGLVETRVRKEADREHNWQLERGKEALAFVDALAGAIGRPINVSDRSFRAGDIDGQAFIRAAALTVAGEAVEDLTRKAGWAYDQAKALLDQAERTQRAVEDLAKTDIGDEPSRDETPLSLP
jgi:hypothetical protein